MKRFGVLLVVLLLFSMLAVQTVSAGSSWAGIYQEWQYRREIIISNPNNYDLTNFQVKIILSSSNFDSWDNVKSDGSDIRFADAQGNALSYYIEYWNSTSKQAAILVKVPSIPAKSTTTIYMYYGNPSAISRSNAQAVGYFYDDFSKDSSLDASRWTLNDGGIFGTNTFWFTGSATFNTAIGLASGSAPGIILHNGRNMGGNAIINWAFTGNTLHLQFDINFDNEGYGVAFFAKDPDNQYRLYFHGNDDNKLYLRKIEGGTITNLATKGSAVPIKGTVNVYVTPQEVRVYVNGVLWIDYKGTIKKFGDKVGFASGTGGLGGHGYILNKVIITTYADQEPTISVGHEEINGLYPWCFKIPQLSIYQNSIYTLTFTLTPFDASATYNTYLSLSGLSDIIEVRKDGSVISPESGMYYLGDISGPTQVSIKFKAGAVGTHGFTLTLTSNDAIMSKTYTTTKQVTYQAEPLPFSVQMPSEWQVGENELRISESSGQSYLITAVLKDSQGNEVWSDSHAFSPYEAHTFQINVPAEGSYTLELQWNGQTAVYSVQVNPAITLKTKTLTVQKGGEGTITLHFKNPSSNVQYYTIKVSGGFLPKEINQSISIAPLTEKDVSIAFAVPEELTYDAYELNVAVMQGNATVFSDKVAVSISDSSGFSLFGGGTGTSMWAYVLLGLLVLGGVIFVLRR